MENEYNDKIKKIAQHILYSAFQEKIIPETDEIAIREIFSHRRFLAAAESLDFFADFMVDLVAKLLNGNSVYVVNFGDEEKVVDFTPEFINLFNDEVDEGEDEDEDEE